MTVVEKKWRHSLRSNTKTTKSITLKIYGSYTLTKFVDKTVRILDVYGVRPFNMAPTKYFLLLTFNIKKYFFLFLTIFG
jgi:hypothetical protein